MRQFMLFPKKFALALHTGILLTILATTGLANDLKSENVHFIHRPETTGEMRAMLDLSWQNAWHSNRNHDAAWIFLKFIYPNGNGYAHATLASDGHRALAVPGSEVPPAQIEVSEDRTGFFIYATKPHRGAVQWRVSVQLDTTAYQQRFRQARLEAYGIEMVYIPEGPFTLGDPGSAALNFGAFYKSDDNGQPNGLIRVNSEAEISVGNISGQLYYQSQTQDYQGDQLGPVPAAFPKGFQAFYLMKYELNQGQYAGFLNTLSDEATFELFTFGGRSYFDKRGTIRLEGHKYVAGRPQRPLNFSSWDGGLAFADWAALRPMTELEYTKASRGPETPKAGEFPWGTASRDRLAREVGPDDELGMTNDWEESKLTDQTREVFGASYYWVMDLAGSVWERVITIGKPDGRAFQGSHGDGRLGERSHATNDDWPHDYAGKQGHGYRGGGFYDQGMRVHEFNPHSPIAYRRYGAWSGAFPSKAYGFRCARTAPR